MKKNFLLVLISVLSVSLLAGCNNKKDDKEDTKEPQSEEIAEEISDYTTLSVKDLEVLAYSDDPVACFHLGQVYDYALNGEAQNYEKAAEWYEKAREYDHAGAYTALGYMYMNGLGVDKDVEKAREYFEQATLLGDNEAYVGWGRSYLLEENVTPEDACVAYNYIREGSEAGCVDGLYYMGYMYQQGWYMKQDYELARSFYERAAKATDLDVTVAYITDAANTALAVLYINGYGVEQDYDAALELLENAADNDYRVANYYLGIMYENGYGVDKDAEEAVEYFEKAADADFAPAINQLGLMYFNGQGVDASYEQAVYYQKLAAAQDYTPSQINLGYMYENGYGVEQDLNTALAYYKLAADKSYEGAKEAIIRVEKKINE